MPTSPKRPQLPDLSPQTFAGRLLDATAEEKGRGRRGGGRLSEASVRVHGDAMFRPMGIIITR
jgi:hypothetical protein